ncbi:MAG: serine/threonine protein phosphatase [Pseudomonadota bacterium]|nr:serine/threonine protein phosphatase [Pseudomonadota bacterium]
MSDHSASVHRFELNGQPAWLKRYGRHGRTLRLAALSLVVRRLDVLSLQPPPRHLGDDARATEQRRIGELRELQVRVPSVLGHGNGFLVLSDLGETLSVRLRRSEPREAERLFSEVAQAIVRVHADGGYLGQPLARNIAVSPDGEIGFLDFEEDPGEVMTLQQAQVRDWLIFVAGAARHLPCDEVRMGELIGRVLREAQPEVRSMLAASTARLDFLRSLCRWFGRRAGGLGKAVHGLQRALWTASLLLVMLGIGLDYAHDAELHLIDAIADWID